MRCGRFGFAREAVSRSGCCLCVAADRRATACTTQAPHSCRKTALAMAGTPFVGAMFLRSHGSLQGRNCSAVYQRSRSGVPAVSPKRQQSNWRAHSLGCVWGSTMIVAISTCVVIKPIYSIDLVRRSKPLPSTAKSHAIRATHTSFRRWHLCLMISKSRPHSWLKPYNVSVRKSLRRKIA